MAFNESSFRQEALAEGFNPRRGPCDNCDTFTRELTPVKDSPEWLQQKHSRGLADKPYRIIKVCPECAEEFEPLVEE